MIVLILKAILKDNTIQLVIYILMFISGFGAGGAIADAINGWGKETGNERDNQVKHDRISAAQTIRQMRIESERKRSKDSRSGKEDEHQDKGQQP